MNKTNRKMPARLTLFFEDGPKVAFSATRRADGIHIATEHGTARLTEPERKRLIRFLGGDVA